MSPAENIYFLLIGVIALVFVLFVLLLFRKRKKWAIALTSLAVLGYVGYYIYSPFMKVNTHAERYEQLMDYLDDDYPGREFTISPIKYEAGYTVGQFDVNDIEKRTIGVTLRVDENGQVAQTSYWTNEDYPLQQDLWREIEFIYGESYTLDKISSEITKQDEWIEGEQTAFALTIDDKPAIALFNYSKAGFGLLQLQREEQKGFVAIEENGSIFIYVDERYEGETVTLQLENGEDYTQNVEQLKGQLIVKSNVK